MNGAPLSVVIVGAGFSGHAAAIALLQAVHVPLQIAMIDAGDRRGGLAYGRAGEHHLLNTRAGQFSVLGKNPDDFAGWARQQVLSSGPVVDLSGSFLPRDMVPAYLQDRLHQVVLAHRKTTIMYLTAKVGQISRHGQAWRAHLGLGNWIDSDALILATGYGYRRRRDFGLDPFGDLSSRRVQKARCVAFVGSGLTFIDAWQRLKAMGFDGKAVAISGSGFLPEAHASDAVRPVQPATRPGMSLRKIVRTLRLQAGELAEGDDWRGLVNAVRDQASLLWQALNEADKERFFRHVAPYWNKVRHRVSPDIHARTRRDIESGCLRLSRGRVSSARKLWNGWQVLVQREGDQEKLGPFDLVFDCTSPSVRSVFPVAAPLIETGRAVPGPCGIGLNVDAAGAVKDVNGTVSSSLFAVGPIGQGALLEITGATEIVAQAERMARVVSTLQDNQSCGPSA